MSHVRKLTNPAEVSEVLAAPRVLVYKHSDRCGTSTWAQREVRAFADRHPDAPIVWVDVIRDRALSRLIAERTGVVHESPQVILLENGAAVWHASHGEITEEELAGRLVAS